MPSLVLFIKFLLSNLLVLMLLPTEEALKIARCKNNGSLNQEYGEPVCVCSYPFTGRLCEDYACVNGLSIGDQYDSKSLFFSRHCLCDAGWTGELCETSIVNRCGNNGEERHGKCVCQKHFVGDRCQFVTKCKHGQLYNGRCSCHYGWAGDFCDKIICHQGAPDEKNEICICPKKYRGKYCDFCAEPASSPPPECAEINGRRSIQIDGGTFSIIMAVVIIIALVIVGAVFYLLYNRISRLKNAVKIARQTEADVGSSLSGQGKEICPLHGSKYAEENTTDSEKYHNPPPPSYYKTVIGSINL